jgi:hypothetical protein
MVKDAITCKVVKEVDPDFDAATLRKYRMRDQWPETGLHDDVADLTRIRIMVELNRRHRMDLKAAASVAEKAVHVAEGRTRIVGHKRSGGRGVSAIEIGYRFLVVTDTSTGATELMPKEGISEGWLRKFTSKAHIVVDAVGAMEAVKAKLRELGEFPPEGEPKP